MYLGDYLHLTRQHWISFLSLILPGNDDDTHLLTATRKTAFRRNSLPLSLREQTWCLRSDRSASQDPSYPTVLDCTTVALTLSGNDVSWAAVPSTWPWDGCRDTVVIRGRRGRVKLVVLNFRVIPREVYFLFWTCAYIKLASRMSPLPPQATLYCWLFKLKRKALTDVNT